MLNNGQESDGRGAVTPSTVRIAVVGVGRIGIHRAVTFAEAGVDVVGYDVDESRIAAYRRGHDPTGTVDDERLAAATCSFSADPECLATADLVFVAVPTRHAPDAGEPHATIRSVGRTVGEHCAPGATVVLESTVPPGTTADVFAPAVEGASDRDAGASVDVAYAPERFSMGSSAAEWRAEPRLVGADVPAVAARVAAAYELVYETVHVVEGTAVAEAAKCVENVYRDATIAVVNELASALAALGVDADRALAAAATKRNVPNLEPGLVGGQCLPEDPLLFADRVGDVGESMPLVRTARAV
ncbi:nucleotide sugar dehydrogenase, partial [Halobaculum marinum]